MSHQPQHPPQPYYPQYPPQRQGMHGCTIAAIVIASVIAVIALGCGGLLFLGARERQTQPNGSTPSASGSGYAQPVTGQYTHADIRAAIYLDAKELGRVYETNEIDGDSRYRDKLIMVVGRPVTLQRNAFGEGAFLNLAGGIHCQFEAADKGPLASIDTNSRAPVTVIGRCTKYSVLVGVVLADCAVVPEGARPAAPPPTATPSASEEAAAERPEVAVPTVASPQSEPQSPPEEIGHDQPVEPQAAPQPTAEPVPVSEPEPMGRDIAELVGAATFEPGRYLGILVRVDSTRALANSARYVLIDSAATPGRDQCVWVRFSKEMLKQLRTQPLEGQVLLLDLVPGEFTPEVVSLRAAE